MMDSETPARSPTWSRARRAKERTRSRSARRTACLPPIPRTTDPIRPRAGCSSIRCSPIRPWCSAPPASPPLHDEPGRHARRIDRLAGRGARKSTHCCAGCSTTSSRTATPLTADFESFVRDGGDRLREHALFEALHQHWFGAPEPKWHWNDWPDDWRAPTAPALARFAAAESRAIRVPPVPAMARGAQLRARATGRTRRRHAHRVDLRSCDRDESGRQPCLVAPAGPAARPECRRAARSVQHARAGLGPDRLLAAEP